MARFAEFYARSMPGAWAPRIRFSHYLELSTQLRALLRGKQVRGTIDTRRYRRAPCEDCRLDTVLAAMCVGASPLPAVPGPAVPILVGD